MSLVVFLSQIKRKKNGSKKINSKVPDSDSVSAWNYVYAIYDIDQDRKIRGKVLKLSYA